MNHTNQQLFKKYDLVLSTVHNQVGTIIDVKWKPNDEQWAATWMYRLDIYPNCWMYQSVLRGLNDGNNHNNQGLDSNNRHTS